MAPPAKRKLLPSAARTNAWLVLLVGSLAGAVAYPFVGSSALRAGMLAVAAYVATVVIPIGIAWFRPRVRLPWIFLWLAQLLWAVGNTFWALEIARTGVTPAPDAWFNALFLGANLLIAAALGSALLARGEIGGAFMEATIVAAAGGAVAWATITHHYFQSPASDFLTAGGTASLVAYSVLDLVIAAAAFRLLVSGRLPVPLVLLVVSCLGLVFSDGMWNWLTVTGAYVAGSWADLGWLLTSLLAGVAALHPAMATAFETRQGGVQRFRWSRVVLLGLAVLVPPLTIVVGAVIDIDTEAYIGIGVAAGILGVLVIARNAANLRLLERSARTLAERNDQLLELDRLKDEFVASVSHELRTPLTSIRGYLELLREDASDRLEPHEREYLEIVERNVGRLLTLVGDLLDVAQAQNGQLVLDPAPCDPNAIALDSVARARPAAERSGIALTLLATDGRNVRADAGRVSQVVDNLISNAIKFTPRGGEVRVRVRSVAGAVEIDVDDDGLGIAAGDVPHLFERFYRTSAATEGAIQGTGLGLAISRSIVEAHGGTIAVTSTPGTGSTFTVRLPSQSAAGSRKALAA